MVSPSRQARGAALLSVLALTGCLTAQRTVVPTAQPRIETGEQATKRFQVHLRAHTLWLNGEKAIANLDDPDYAVPMAERFRAYGASRAPRYLKEYELTVDDGADLGQVQDIMALVGTGGFFQARLWNAQGGFPVRLSASSHAKDDPILFVRPQTIELWTPLPAPPELPAQGEAAARHPLFALTATRSLLEADVEGLLATLTAPGKTARPVLVAVHPDLKTADFSRILALVGRDVAPGKPIILSFPTASWSPASLLSPRPPGPPTASAAPVSNPAAPSASAAIPATPAAPGTLSGNLPPSIIQSIVRQNFGSLRACYEDGLRRDPRLKGRVAVRFVIDRDGTVASVGPNSSDLPDPGVVACVVRSFEPLLFPRPRGGLVTVAYPISFIPGD